MIRPIVVGISGASGVTLGQLTIKTLLNAGYRVELVMTKNALLTAHYEMGPERGTLKGFLATFTENELDNLSLHKLHDMGSLIASGSYKTEGMLVIPCSMSSLSAIALGLSDTVLRRAADVTLKERRRLVVVPREMPLHEMHLEHMLKITRLGGIIVPPMPAWYTRPKTLLDVEQFIVGKALDLFDIPHELYPRWSKNEVLSISCS